MDDEIIEVSLTEEEEDRLAFETLKASMGMPSDLEFFPPEHASYAAAEE